MESYQELLPKAWVDRLNLNEKKALDAFLEITSKEQMGAFQMEESLYPQFYQFVKELVEINSFYDSVGGIRGYQDLTLKLIHELSETTPLSIYTPEGWNIEEPLDEMVLEGISSLEWMAEMYPVGGAGDRLNLRDSHTQEDLPAALLPFLGRSLLEGLIRDLQAREFLFYKIFKKRLLTPVALMTSLEKNNEGHIRRLLEDNGYFGRPKESFFLFLQPQAPLVTKEGRWVVSTDWQLAKKPGGHGVIWKLSLDSGVFEWFKEQKRRFCLVRQINNPISGLDQALGTFCGIGVKEKKSFGFLSCPRKVYASEGMNLLLEKLQWNKRWVGITNIEYTDFLKRGIVDEPIEGFNYSKYPSNTNILFVDLEKVEKKVIENPFPGLIFNPKTVVDLPGSKEIAGRLESAMQNMADAFLDSVPDGLIDYKKLSTFMAYNSRIKTISVTKRSAIFGGSIEETPLGCYFDYLANMHELFSSCGMEMPPFPLLNEYNPSKPPFIIAIHPALGPHWSIIRQKIEGGRIAEFSEMELEIAEIKMANCKILGSFRVIAKEPFSMSFAIFEEVTVENRGVDFEAGSAIWDGDIKRHESLEIVLEGVAEFIARGVHFRGNQRIIVPDGWRYIAYQKGNLVEFAKERIKSPKELWSYEIVEAFAIRCLLNE